MKGKGNAVQLPEVEMSDVTDYYTVYVGIMGVSENVFWNCPIGFVKDVAANQTAYQKWMNRQMEQTQSKRRRRK